MARIRWRQCQCTGRQSARLEPVELRLRRFVSRPQPRRRRLGRHTRRHLQTRHVQTGLSVAVARAPARETGNALNTHRPRLARCCAALKKSVVHRKRQPRRAVALPARCKQRDRAQRVVQVGRVHYRALARRARPQTRHRSGATDAPRLRERAVARAVLQPHRVEAVVQRADERRARARASTHRRRVDTLPRDIGGERARAVHRRVRERVVHAAAHVEAAVGHGALDVQPIGLDGQRLQEEDAAKALSRGRGMPHLEIARGGENDAALHHVVLGEAAAACSGRLEGNGAVGGEQAALRKGMRTITPCERAPAVRDRPRWQHTLVRDVRNAQHGVPNRASVPERTDPAARRCRRHRRHLRRQRARSSAQRAAHVLIQSAQLRIRRRRTRTQPERQRE